MPLFIKKHPIHLSDHCSFLGIKLDSRLKFNLHINELHRKTSCGIRVLLKARGYFDLTILITLYYAFIHSHLNYCIASWGQTYHCHLSSLQHVQNQAIRILTWSNRRSRVTILYRELHILNIDNLIKFNVCTFAYQVVEDHSLLKFVLIQQLTNSNITRFSTNNNFILPKVRTNYGSQGVAFVLIKLWNSLPYNIKCAFSISSFKHTLHNFLFNL